MPTILVVEDSPTMRQLISFAMRRIPGSKVIEATDGVDALKKLSSEKADIILADINMPVMDGLKLVSLVRGSSEFRDIPIIIITTEGAEEDRKKAMDILDQLNKGEKFETLAKKYSEDPSSAEKGGDLGYFKKGQMVKPFEETAFSLKPGETSSPVRTQFGFHIIRVEDKKQAGTKPLEEVKSEIEEDIRKSTAVHQMNNPIKIGRAHV